MGDALMLGLLIVAIGFACFWMMVYSFLLYRLGRRLAVRIVRQSQAFWTTLGICGVPLVVAVPIWSLFENVIARVAAAFAVWLLHVQPTLIGLWAGLGIRRKKDVELFAKRTREWLSEWEAPIAGLSEFDE